MKFKLTRKNTLSEPPRPVPVAEPEDDTGTAMPFFRDAAARILGPEAERIFGKWGRADAHTLDRMLAATRDMNMSGEFLALGLWRLTEAYTRPELGLDAKWLPDIFSAAQTMGAAKVAQELETFLPQTDQEIANRSLDVAALHLDLGETDAASTTLQTLPPSPHRQQLLFDIQLRKEAPDTGMLLATLLRYLPDPTRKVLWKMRPMVGGLQALKDDPRLLRYIAETCHDDALPFVLACAVEAGHIGAIPRDVLSRIHKDRRFWSTLVGRDLAEARLYGMGEINALTFDAGIGIFSMTSDDRAFGDAGPLPHLHATSMVRAARSEPVSVIMACYDGQDTIEHALRSICSQGHADLQVVVIDDCSPTPLRLEQDWFMGRDVILHRNETNQGPYASRNTGLDLARGSIIGFHDADDFAHPDKIADQMNCLSRNDAIAHYGGTIRIRPDGLITPENNGRFLGDGPITGLFRREVFDRVGRFAPVRTRGDIEFRRRLGALLGKDAVINNSVPYVLALDWDSNSKRMTKSVADWQKIRDFLTHARTMTRIASFTADAGKYHNVINRTMPLSLRHLAKTD